MTGAYDVAEANFFFDRSNGQLLAMEMFPDVDVDPCELQFSDYREVDGLQLPHRIEVRYGDRQFGVITVKLWKADVDASKGAE